MTTMLETIVPKSDQLNADDLIGGRTLTIKVTQVSMAMGEQPVSVHYEGDNGKPYKPGKSMRRVLVNCWGSDANLYIGRSMTLYRDEKVKFGGIDVGGIRISHLSDIKEPITMALTATKAQRRPFTVKPLIIESLPTADDYIADFATASKEKCELMWKQVQKQFKDSPDFARIHAAKEARKKELTTV